MTEKVYAKYTFVMDEQISPEKAALKRAAEILGGQVAVALACGFPDRRHVWPWFNTKRRVPAEHCPAIERATAGQVRCEQLRPDVAWDVLRETAIPPVAVRQEATHG